MEDISTSNNNTIRQWAKPFIDEINAKKRSLGIKHRRTMNPIPSKVKFKIQGGEIFRISVTMSKGDMMSHKGEGANKQNRVAKPFYNPVAETRIPQLADQLASNLGDVICGNLVKL